MDQSDFLCPSRHHLKVLQNTINIGRHASKVPSSNAPITKAHPLNNGDHLSRVLYRDHRPSTSKELVHSLHSTRVESTDFTMHSVSNLGNILVVPRDGDNTWQRSHSTRIARNIPLMKTYCALEILGRHAEPDSSLPTPLI